MKALRSVKWSMLLMGLITAAVGAIIVFHPKATAETVIRIAGWILVAAGGLSLLAFLADKKKGVHSYTDLLVGAVVTAIGLALGLSPATFVNFIGYIFGVILAIHGLNDLVTSAGTRKYDDKHWLKSSGFGILCLIMAAIVFFVPFSTISILMIFIGIFLMIDGISDVILALRVGVVAGRFLKEEELAAQQQAAQDVEFTVIPEPEAAQEPETAAESVPQQEDAQ
ncbi:MAG: DUF308 domain-containing protein [Eubacterium sp.]|nr:DUF308 domain-containing protein [Eubacterium sp.]